MRCCISSFAGHRLMITPICVIWRLTGRAARPSITQISVIMAWRLTMANWRALRPGLPILLAASAMLTLAMGIRQTFGLFLQPITQGLSLSVADFALALSLQNLVWGLLQPVSGALVVRLGFRPILFNGAVLYLAGLALLAAAQGFLAVLIGASVLVGASLACTASAIAQAVASGAVPASVRSLVL